MAVKDNKNLDWKEFMEENAKNKKKPLPDWFEGIVKNILGCKMATHIGKFSNPDVEETILVYHEPGDLGYVTTENTSCVTDMWAPAPYLGTAGLLFASVDETQNVLETVCNNPEYIKKELAGMLLPSEKLCRDVLELRNRSIATPAKTDERISQVYFPVGNGEYHLLSVLPASSLLIELRKRILAMSNQRKQSIDESHEDFGKPWDEVTKLTVIGLGGNNPQNLSILNARQAGKAFLLYSMPPVLGKRQLIYPKRDYFKEVLRYKKREGLFVALHHCIQLDKNNVNIRNKIDELTDGAMDYVMAGVYALRKNTKWTDDEKYKNLSLAQKIWLDNQYREARKDTEWVEKISHQFARWMIWAYERVNSNDDKNALGDNELHYFKKKMEELLKEEERYGV